MVDITAYRHRVTLEALPVAIRPVRPRQKFRLPRFVQSAAACPVGHLAPFVFSHHPLHLCQELTVGSIPKGMFHKDDATAVLLELFHLNLARMSVNVCGGARCFNQPMALSRAGVPISRTGGPSL